jgi:hypothetical protein
MTDIKIDINLIMKKITWFISSRTGPYQWHNPLSTADIGNGTGLWCKTTPRKLLV